MKSEKVKNYSSKAAMKNLQKAYSNQNREQKVLSITVVLTIILFFSVFSLTFGKLNAEIIRNSREDGTTVVTYLIGGTEEDEEQLEQLDFVEKIGHQKQVGALYKNDKKYATCIYTDEESFLTMFKPAYTNVQGNYPKEKNEIMMSCSILKSLGIDNPEVGMKLILDFQWDAFSLYNHNGEKEFILSGYFQEYCVNQSDKMRVFVSEAMLTDINMNLYPLDIMVDVEPWYLNREQIETKLSENMHLKENQWFVSSDTAVYKATENVFGGIGMGFLLGCIILLSMFLVVYNIWSISLNKEIRQYGMMEVIGVSNSKIVNMFKRRNIKIWMIGSCIGGSVASIVVMLFMPYFIQKMYLDDMGSIENIPIFYPKLLIFVILFSGVILYVGTSMATKKIKQLTPLEAMKYEDIDEDCGRIVTLKNAKQFSLKDMAKRNVLRSKRKFIITVLSIFMGCQVALVAIAVTNGLDVAHKLGMNQDFTVSLNIEMLKEIGREIDKAECLNTSIFEKKDVEELTKEIEAVNEKYLYGNLPIFDKTDECVYQVLNMTSDLKRNSIVLAEAIEDEKLTELEQYIEEDELEVDEKWFTENGFIVGHQHLANNEDTFTHRKLGVEVNSCKKVVEGERVDTTESVKLVNCGYLDLTDEELTFLDVAWENQEVIYFLVTEDTMEHLSEIMPQYIFQYSFDVETEKENEIKQILKQWIEEKNVEFQNQYETDLDCFTLTCNSDLIQKEKNYIEGSRMIMFSISVILFFVGIMNYFSTVITEIFARKKEFVIMESIGMTRRQLQNLLTLEGKYYCKIVCILLLTLGNLILFFIEMILKRNVEYFKYNYPFVEAMFLFVVLNIMCVVIPKMIYKKIGRENAQTVKFCGDC